MSDKRYIGYMVVMKKTMNETQIKRITDLLETMDLNDYIVPIELDDLLSVLKEEVPS